MLGKLMKYDLKGLYKQLVPVYLIGLLISVVCRLFDLLVDKYSFLSIPSGFMDVIFVILLIALPIYTFFVTIIKYYKSMVKDEAYLTHTLPVKKSSLVLSKLFDGIITMLSSIGVMTVLLLIRSIGYNYITEFIQTIKTMVFSTYETEFIVIFFISLLVGLIMGYTIVFTAIALGQLHNNKKLVMSCIYTVALYYVNQVIGVILLVVPIIINPKFLTMLEQDTPPMKLLNGYMILSVTLSIILAIVYYLITVKLMSKKLNLE